MKIVHVADIHLGYRAYNKLSPEGLNIREKDVLRTFKETLDKVSQINADLMIVAGDVFHKPRPSNSSIYNSIILLQSFRKKSCMPILLISGNHEASKSVEAGSILRILETSVSGIRVIDGQIEQIPFKELNISVLGIPYNALCEFEKVNILPDSNFKYNILAVHGSFESIKCPELSRYGNESILNAENLNQARWDYIALGHYHKFSKLSENTFYSGAIERTSSNIWQEANEPKGFIEYNLETRQEKFHTLETPRKVLDLPGIDVSDLSGEETDQVIENQVSKIHNFENAVVRLTLENIDPVAIRNLDFKKIRQYKKKALHFRINLVKKGSLNSNNSNSGIIKERKNIYEYFEEELKNFEFSQKIDKSRFEKISRSYLYENTLTNQ